MSANACVVYFGLRFDVPADGIEAVETRSDPRIVAARKAGLKSYWGNFAARQASAIDCSSARRSRSWGRRTNRR